MTHPHNQTSIAGTLAGLRVLITGGTSGLGLALVRALASRGSRVAFVARGRERVDAVAASTGTLGIVGDVASKRDIHPIALQVTGVLGGVDVLVNNASSLGPDVLKPLGDTQCEELEHALATNLVGPFRLTRALLGALAAAARQHGVALVVNISSDAAINAYEGWGAYGASKAALHHMTRIWHAELAAAGIRFLSMDPGDMDTPLHAQAMPDADPRTLKAPARAAEDVIAVMVAALAARVPDAAAHARTVIA